MSTSYDQFNQHALLEPQSFSNLQEKSKDSLSCMTVFFLLPFSLKCLTEFAQRHADCCYSDTELTTSNTAKILWWVWLITTVTQCKCKLNILNTLFDDIPVLNQLVKVTFFFAPFPLFLVTPPPLPLSLRGQCRCILFSLMQHAVAHSERCGICFVAQGAYKKLQKNPHLPSFIPASL